MLIQLQYLQRLVPTATETLQLDRLEEFEDVEDLKAIRHEPTRPLAEVLAELKLDGSV